MRGYFGIGIYHPKTKQNIGTLWRSAFQMGASFIFTIGPRYKKQSSDTYKTWRHVPLYNYADWDIFKKHVPYDSQLVAIEMGGMSLPDFDHPERCIYLLGAEDYGLSDKMIGQCQHIATIPTIGLESFNVAVAGSIIMYDRMVKMKALLEVLATE